MLGYSLDIPSEGWVLIDKIAIFEFSTKSEKFLVYHLKMDSAMAMKTWELANNIETISSVDEIFKYDRQQQQEMLQAKPWVNKWAGNLQLF